MADLFIKKVSKHFFTNRDGYDSHSGKFGLQIEFRTGAMITFKEGVTKNKALELVGMISDVEKGRIEEKTCPECDGSGDAGKRCCEMCDGKGEI